MYILGQLDLITQVSRGRRMGRAWIGVDEEEGVRLDTVDELVS